MWSLFVDGLRTFVLLIHTCHTKAGAERGRHIVADRDTQRQPLCVVVPVLPRHATRRMMGHPNAAGGLYKHSRQQRSATQRHIDKSRSCCAASFGWGFVLLGTRGSDSYILQGLRVGSSSLPPSSGLMRSLRGADKPPPRRRGGEIGASRQEEQSSKVARDGSRDELDMGLRGVQRCWRARACEATQRFEEASCFQCTRVHHNLQSCGPPSSSSQCCSPLSTDGGPLQQPLREALLVCCLERAPQALQHVGRRRRLE